MYSRGSLQGARLLTLGAGPYQIPVIRRAMELGCHVITVDNNPLNPGHRLADAFEIVSTVDAERILEVARRHSIDGVLTYGSDVSVPAVAYVAEQLGLPGNEYRVAAQLQRKDEIRRLQQRLSLPHPRFVAASTASDLAAQARRERLPFPALVKPADSSGSKGQSVVRSLSGFGPAFNTASLFSRCGVIVAEEILPSDLMELVCEAVIEDGRLVFAHYGHNWFCRSDYPRVPVGEIVPGVFGDAVVRELDLQIQALVSGARVRSGCLNADALLSGSEVFLLDIGLRNGGYFLPEVVRLSSGVDITAAAIHAALGARFEIPSLHVEKPACVVSQVMHSHTSGPFASTSLDPAIEPHVVLATQFVGPGEAVNEYTRGDAGVGMIIFEQPSAEVALDYVSRVPHPCTVHLDQVAG